ncbi:MAG: hypothetical protein K9G76_11560 [Bacteroidales bacterium]|nr:hypothetical protein [Bacteroidales bacterium]MCF8405115.1 hypothetical protein [Bacteroidales bacterium]
MIRYTGILIISLFLFSSGFTQGTSDSLIILPRGALTIAYRGEVVKLSKIGDIVENTPEAYESFRRADANNAAMNGCGLVGGFIIGYQLGSLLGGAEVDEGWIVTTGAGLVFVGLSLGFQMTRNRHLYLTVKKYNESLKPQAGNQKKEMILGFGFQKHGMGINLCF